MITSPGKEFEILSRTIRAVSEGHAEYNNPTRPQLRWEDTLIIHNRYMRTNQIPVEAMFHSQPLPSSLLTSE